MAIARVSGNTWTGATIASSTSVNHTLANAVTSGSMLVAFAAVGANETVTFSDGVNTWVSNAIRVYQTNLAATIQIGYALNCASGSTTVTQSGAATANRAIYVCEYTGAATASAVDGTPVSATADASTSNPDPGGITSTGGAVFIGGFVLDPAGTETPGTGYTKQVESSAWGGYQLDIEDQIFTTAQTGEHPKLNSDSDYWGAIGLALKAAPSGTVTQADFRFYNDDGSESAATASQAQGTDDTVALNTARVVRFLLQGTGDPDAASYKLKFQKNGTGGYSTVQTATTTTTAPTIEAGDVTESGNNTATTSWAVSYPAYVSGDLLIFHVASDANVTHNWPGTGPNGETITDIKDSIGGTAQRASGFWFVGSATTGASTLTVTPSASEQWTAAVIKVPAGEFNASTPIQTNKGEDNDTTADASWDTPAWTADAIANGRVVVFAAHDTVTTSATPTGWTTLAATDRGAVGLTLAIRDAANTASESIASASFTKTSETDSSFGYVINGVVSTNEIYIAASSNITDGGEDTTNRLTGGTGAFVTGRIWDNENGSDSLNITEDDFTEVAWNLKMQSPATASDYFDLRVYNGEVALDTYTDTPRLTVAGSGTTYTRTVTDASAITEGSFQWFERSRLSTDVLVTIDQAVAQLSSGGVTYIEAMEDVVVISEGNFRSIWRGRVQGEGVASVTDGNGFFREHYTHMYEAMDVADAVGKLTVRGRVASDNAAINDQIAQWFRRVRSTDEVVVVTDSPQWVRRVVRLVNDGATIVEAIVSSIIGAGGAIYPVIVTDAVVTVDDILRHIMVSRLAGDTATISDGSVISYERIRATTDAASVIDALASLLITGQITYKDVSETIGISDQMLAVFQRAREVVDTIQITDDTVIVRWSVKYLTEELGVSEDIAKALYTAYLVAVRVRLGNDPFPVGLGGYNPVRLGGHTLQ